MGFDWDPKTGKLWFTENGRDNMGNDIPQCELNVLNNEGEPVSYTHLRAHETVLDLVCRLLLEKKKK